jgi:hypothetical protein
MGLCREALVGVAPFDDVLGIVEGRKLVECNNPAFRTKRRVDLGLVCIHASKTLNKFFARIKENLGE